ncbi:hypothetical protein HBI55_182740 [Parastagonospora nodorum]|nr:hypothetical protein HBI55_182740 [Parastagonospora nodorum]
MVTGRAAQSQVRRPTHTQPSGASHNAEHERLLITREEEGIGARCGYLAKDQRTSNMKGITLALGSGGGGATKLSIEEA